VKTPCKVYALRQGVKGFDATGARITIAPGMRGFMEMADALAQEQLGNVDICVGRSTVSLRPVEYETRVMVPGSADDPNNVVDEDPPVLSHRGILPPEAAPASTPVEPPKPPRKPRAPRKYKRSDMTAEKP